MFELLRHAWVAVPWWIWVDIAVVAAIVALLQRATQQLTKVDSLFVLLQQDDHPWWYGLDLVKCSHGTLQRGTIYILLDELETKGYVKSRIEEESNWRHGIPRRLYAITEKGAKYHKDLVLRDKVALLRKKHK